MQRKIKSVLVTILSVLGVFGFYVVMNWEQFLDLMGITADFIKGIQTQIWAVLALASFASSFYKKFRESRLPLKISQIMSFERLNKALEFFDELLQRFSAQEVMSFLLNVDTLSAEMKLSLSVIKQVIDGEKSAPSPPLKTPAPSPRQKRKDLAIRVAELLRKVGRKVEVDLKDESLFQKLVPSPEAIRGKILSKFGKQLEDADLRKQERLREMQETLRKQQDRLATMLSDVEKGD